MAAIKYNVEDVEAGGGAEQPQLRSTRERSPQRPIAPRTLAARRATTSRSSLTSAPSSPVSGRTFSLTTRQLAGSSASSRTRWVCRPRARSTRRSSKGSRSRSRSRLTPISTATTGARSRTCFFPAPLRARPTTTARKRQSDDEPLTEEELGDFSTDELKRSWRLAA